MRLIGKLADLQTQSCPMTQRFSIHHGGIQSSHPIAHPSGALEPGHRGKWVVALKDEAVAKRLIQSLTIHWSDPRHHPEIGP